MKNLFGREFNELPIELQREIMIQNASHYQKIVANLILKYNNLQRHYMNMYDEFQDLQSPNSFMNHYLEVYENRNKRYNKQQIKYAYKQLNEHYKPLVKQLRQEIYKIKKELDSKKKEIESNKKQYYYFYNKMKKFNQ